LATRRSAIAVVPADAATTAATTTTATTTTATTTASAAAAAAVARTPLRVSTVAGVPVPVSASASASTSTSTSTSSSTSAVASASAGGGGSKRKRKYHQGSSVEKTPKRVSKGMRQQAAEQMKNNSDGRGNGRIDGSTHTPGHIRYDSTTNRSNQRLNETLYINSMIA